MKNTSKISPVMKYKIIAILTFLIIIVVSILNILMAQKISKNINTQKQQIINQQISSESLEEQRQFFENNPDIAPTLSTVLPTQDTILDVVETIEKLQESLGVGPNFKITSIAPVKDLNSSHVNFIITTNTTTIKSIAFLRSFEKLPYLTRITAVSLKTPQGIGGPVELTITGKIYVQDPF